MSVKMKYESLCQIILLVGSENIIVLLEFKMICSKKLVYKMLFIIQIYT